ncbi:MAG TPA: membrane protein insertase YidC [Candidatus Saccharimonadales bacterium]|nr:membrane protein insertase YidC [Candidatus Saccharimonadales bacterium]
MFTTIIVQPIFNFLVLITAIIPGHNFGLAIIIFTLIIRILMWPLVRKQLNHAKAMRELAPELKKIKAAAKGDRQEESRLTMELYKEKEVNPFASIGILLVQVPILIGLYSGIRKIIGDPHQILTFSYSGLHHLAWMQSLAHNIHNFDETLFGVVNLTRTALDTHGVYWAAMVIVIASAIAQYLQSRQLMPKTGESRGLRAIMREAGKGKQTDQMEVNAAVSRTTLIFVPLVVLLVSLHLAVALPLYWLTSSVIAYIQQSRILREDAADADASVTPAAPPRKVISRPKVSFKERLVKKEAPVAPAQTIETKEGLKVTRHTLGDAKKQKPRRPPRKSKRRRR